MILSEWPLRDKVRPEHTAVLVVDLQHDFCSPGGYMDREGRDLAMVQAALPTVYSFLDVVRSARVPLIFFQANLRLDRRLVPFASVAGSGTAW